MAKAYWIAFYKSIRNPDGFAAYVKLAPAEIQKAGGRFVVRGTPAQVYEQGLKERVVMIEFDSVAQAIAAHDSPDYQAALKAHGNSVEREIRIVEALA